METATASASVIDRTREHINSTAPRCTPQSIADARKLAARLYDYNASAALRQTPQVELSPYLKSILGI